MWPTISATNNTPNVASSSNAANAVPLSAFTRFERNQSPLSINRQGQFPAVTISFNLAPGVALGTAISAVDRVQRELKMRVSVQARKVRAAEVANAIARHFDDVARRTRADIGKRYSAAPDLANAVAHHQAPLAIVSEEQFVGADRISYQVNGIVTDERERVLAVGEYITGRYPIDHVAFGKVGELKPRIVDEIDQVHECPQALPVGAGPCRQSKTRAAVCSETIGTKLPHRCRRLLFLRLNPRPRIYP